MATRSNASRWRGCTLDKGKQVRDNIHAEDVVSLMGEFYRAPRCGEVYNLGGGKENSCSILDGFRLSEKITGKKQRFVYREQNRAGDHICYYSSLAKTQSHFRDWRITKSLPTIVRELAESWCVLLAKQDRS